MKRLFQVVNAVVAGFLGTLVIATTAILVLVFSTREPGTRAVGLLGSVYFEASDRSDGSIALELGVANWMVMFTLWLVLSGLVFVSILIFGRLRRYKQALAERGQDLP